MADFSFSFDSDNPFAEPEQTPKKAAASTDETSAAASASAATPDGAPPPVEMADAPVAEVSVADALVAEVSVPANDEFSLDSFDFAFDEDASINNSLPTRNTPIDEAPFRQLTPGEAAFAEYDFAARDKVAAPEPIAPEPIASEPIAPEPVILEVETLDFSALEVVIPNVETSETLGAPEVETPELESSDKTSARSARSDLEEFNAFTYDFGMPDDELFGSESSAEPIADIGEIEFASVQESPDPDKVPFDFLGVDAPVVEPNAAEAVNAETATIVEAPVHPGRIAMRDDVDDMSLLASVGDEGKGQTEGEFRRLRTRSTLKVAILGASGIGKNHARWFHHHGCQVVGFLGTSPDSTTQTEADLNADFDFQGNAYTDLETLLQTETPDIVCVATPPPLHFGHVLQSLEAGAHVLCEKPLVYAPTRKFRENRDGAKELVKVAARRKLNLGTQLQYGGATPILCKLAGLTPTDVGDFAMELETLNPNAPRDPSELWIDLGPHPISMAQMLAGAGGQLAEETILFEPYQDDDKTEVLARFGINCADGRLLMVRAVVRALRGDNPRQPRRRFSFNGHAITYVPIQNATNGFQAQFVAPDGYASVYPDPVDYLIGNFVRACRDGVAPMITGDFGRENLEWMLKVGMSGEAK